VTSIGFQSDGKIVAAGGSIISRSNPNGSLGATFGLLGSAGSAPSASAVAIQGDQIFAAGAFTGRRAILPDFSPDGDLAVVRYDSDGIVDGTFGLRGAALADFFKEPSSASASAGTDRTFNQPLTSFARTGTVVVMTNLLLALLLSLGLTRAHAAGAAEQA